MNRRKFIALLGCLVPSIVVPKTLGLVPDTLLYITLKQRALMMKQIERVR